MKRTNLQNRRLYGLFGRLGIDEDTRKAMVLNVTRGRTEHTSEMSVEEAKALIEILSAELRRAKKAQYDAKNQLRRRIFRLFYELDWIDAQMSNQEKLEVINNWLAERFKGQSDLNSLTADELERLRKQLQAIKRRMQERQERAEQKKRQQDKEIEKIMWAKKGEAVRLKGPFALLPTGQVICLN